MSLRLFSLPRSVFTNQVRLFAAGADFLKDVPLKNREGNFPISKLQNKAVVLYFSAGWCGHCRLFTPKLKKWYEEAGRSEGVEVIWVSRDKAADDQVEYYKKALPNIPYIPFGDKHIQEFLKKYEVKTIPTARLVDSKGEVLEPEVRQKIEVEGKEDPKKFAKKLVNLAS